jgi:hypothetical protein
MARDRNFVEEHKERLRRRLPVKPTPGQDVDDDGQSEEDELEEVAEENSQSKLTLLRLEAPWPSTSCSKSFKIISLICRKS